MIEIKNLTKKYGNIIAVNNISLKIEDGSIVGFIGRNGAGKTTTIKMMTGIIKPNAGDILINNFSILEDPIEAKKEMFFVPDSPDMFLRLTGKDYLNFIADIYEINIQEKQEYVTQLCTDFKIIESLGDRIINYSHGMRQKIIIVAAFMVSPPVLIFDEPMTGLDPESSFLLKQKMKEYAKKGHTVFFSTHVLEVAEKLCDKIIILKQGEVLYYDSLDNLKIGNDNSMEHIFLELMEKTNEE